MYNKIIVDGNNFLYRAYYIQRPPQIVNGVNTTPLHQFMYMLKSLKETYSSDEMYITWDKRLNSGGENFRKTLSAYKEHRLETEDTQKIWDLCDTIQTIIPHFGIHTVLPYNLEADDVIGFLAEQEGSSLIVSSDKDMFQLVDKETHVLHRKNVVTLDNFEEIVGVPKDHFVLYKSIMGDVSDNVEGLEKYGPVRSKKLAAEILATGATIENLLNNPDSDPLHAISKEQKEKIINNLKITYLPYAKRFKDEFESYEKQWANRHEVAFDKNEVKRFFSQHKFNNFLHEFGKWNMHFNKTAKTETIDLANILDLISL
jgi:DNA polymerase-1